MIRNEASLDFKLIIKKLNLFLLSEMCFINSCVSD